MDYHKWMDQVSLEIRGDRVWRLEVYRLGLFAADIGWNDITILSRDRRTRGLSDQLYRALGSISANTEEGFSRGTGKDRARFYEYALGSARESRGWYYKGRHVLMLEIVQHRMALLTHVIKLLLTMIPDQRGTEIREEQTDYIADGPQHLLMEIPMAEDEA